MYRAEIEECEFQNALRAKFSLSHEFFNSSVVYIGLLESVNFKYFKIQP